MRISRLFLSMSLAEGDIVDLPEERGHYLKTVLRLRPGNELVVFNGVGGEFSAEMEGITRHGTRLRIGSFHARSCESPLFINLGLGISRGERMDFALQKAAELGVAVITPLATERSVVRLDSERRQSRRDHWRKVAQSACEQCNRTLVPEVAAPKDLDEWLEDCRGLRLLLDPAGDCSLKDLAPRSDGLTLLSGPEGGFTEEERRRAKAADFLSVRLGPRILRTETAVVAALAAIQALWGDLCV